MHLWSFTEKRTTFGTKYYHGIFCSFSQKYSKLNASKYVKATSARVSHKHDYYIALILQNKCAENVLQESRYNRVKNKASCLPNCNILPAKMQTNLHP
jgi:hypothetical protein